MSKRDDISVLRPSIPLGGGDGVSAILNYMKVGTAEIKDALLHQCSIIYECKVCHNLFRGIANFLAHKRVYCQTSFCDPKLAFVDARDEEETVIVQPTPPPEKEKKKSTEWDDFPSSDEEKEREPTAKKERMPVFEQMKQGIFHGSSQEYEFYTKAVERQNRKDNRRKQAKVKLEYIPGNTTAVAQKFESDDVTIVEPKEPKGRGRPKKRKKMDGEEEEENEVKVMKIKKEAEDEVEEVVVVEPKAATGHIRMNLRQRGARGLKGTTMYEQLKVRSDCDVKSLECLKCKQAYSTVKTLHFHMTSQHDVAGRRTFYPCPLCSAVYAQAWSTTRHIAKAHGHTQQQARAMVGQIRKSAFQKSIGELRIVTTNFGGPPEKKSTPVASTSTSGSAKSSDEFGLDFVIHRCKGCNKLFERKESHDRHARSCSQAKAVDRESLEIKDTKDERTNSPVTAAAIASTLSQIQSNEFTPEEMASIVSIIDETTHQCLRCYRMFGTISNLHRHAIRHLGWRRFKCQFCRFLSYNKSECRRHLRVVHKKAIDKAEGGAGAASASTSASALDDYIVDIQAADIEASPKSNLPRVEMQTMGRGSPRKTRGATKAAAAARDTLVTRSGMYNKPVFKLPGKGSKNGNEDSDSDTSDTSVESSKPEEQPEEEEEEEAEVVEAEEEEEADEIKEDEDDIMQVKQDVTSSRSRRKGQTPQKSLGVAISPIPGGENTPATAKPASHILSQSPAKATITPVLNVTPTKSNAASPSKNPMVNILSKSVPKFSISGGVTTVLLPVFTQCVQVQSGGGGSAGGAKWVKPMTNPSQPHIRVLGPNFQLPGSSGSSQVRTVAVSTLPTSGGLPITGTNTLASRSIIVSSSNVGVSSGPGKFTIAGTRVINTGAATTVIGTAGMTGVTGVTGVTTGAPRMPVLAPISVDAPSSVPNPVTVSLDSTCQLSPAMPSLAPIAVTTTAAGVSIEAPCKRSQTPQPIRIVQEQKPRSFTPNPPITLEPQITIESLPASETSSTASSDLIQNVALYPKTDDANIRLISEIQEALSSNGQSSQEQQLITISTESSCSSFPHGNVDDAGDYVVSVTPVSDILKAEASTVTQDEFVTPGAEPVVEGTELLNMIDSSAATDPMQYINQ